LGYILCRPSVSALEAMPPASIKAARAASEESIPDFTELNVDDMMSQDESQKTTASASLTELGAVNFDIAEVFAVIEEMQANNDERAQMFMNLYDRFGEVRRKNVDLAKELKECKEYVETKQLEFKNMIKDSEANVDGNIREQIDNITEENSQLRVQNAYMTEENRKLTMQLEEAKKVRQTLTSQRKGKVNVKEKAQDYEEYFQGKERELYGKKISYDTYLDEVCLVRVMPRVNSRVRYRRFN